MGPRRRRHGLPGSNALPPRPANTLRCGTPCDPGSARAFLLRNRGHLDRKEPTRRRLTVAVSGRQRPKYCGRLFLEPRCQPVAHEHIEMIAPTVRRATDIFREGIVGSIHRVRSMYQNHLCRVSKSRVGNDLLSNNLRNDRWDNRRIIFDGCSFGHEKPKRERIEVSTGSIRCTSAGDRHTIRAVVYTPSVDDASAPLCQCGVASYPRMPGIEPSLLLWRVVCLPKRPLRNCPAQGMTSLRCHSGHRRLRWSQKNTCRPQQGT